MWEMGECIKNEHTRLFYYNRDDDCRSCFSRAYGVDCRENQQKVIFLGGRKKWFTKYG